MKTFYVSSESAEETPLLPATGLNKKQIFSSHSLAGFYNILTVILYFVSANGFWKHLAEAQDTPPFIREKLHNLDHNVTDFNADWQYAFFAIYIVGSLFLLLSNQRGMSARIQRMYDWQEYSHGDKQVSRLKKSWIIFEAGMSSLWKTLVSSASLLAGLAPYTGFWPGFAIAIMTLPGNLFAQMSNFLDPFFKTLGTVPMPSWLKKVIAGYLVLGYCISNMALYWNTIDQGPLRLGWMQTRLLELQSILLRVIVNIFHGGFNLYFGKKTFEYYYRPIKALISKEQSQLSISDNSGVDVNTDVIANIFMLQTNQNKLSFWKKTDKGGLTAAAYKTAANYLALLAVIALGMRLDHFSLACLIVLITAFLVQIPNFIAQTTFYTSNSNLLEQNNQFKPRSMGKLVECFGYLAKKCCNKLKITASVTTNDPGQSNHASLREITNLKQTNTLN